MTYGQDTLFQNKKDTKFKMTDIIRESEGGPFKYHVILPDFLSEWDVKDYWEKERIQSIQDNMNHGDILFDIGAESGYMSAIFATIVGGENMVLFEPTETYWPGIKAIWEANGFKTPQDVFWGFASDETKNINTSEDCDILDGWPRQAYSDRFIKATSYRYLHEKIHQHIPQITIDDFCGLKGIIPSGITIDTEGAELKILRGAIETLKNHHLFVWVSEHPDLQKKFYNIEKGQIKDFMEELGYTGELLAIDHEEHWLYK